MQNEQGEESIISQSSNTVADKATDNVTKLTERMSDLIKEKGTGVVITAIGSVFTILCAVDQMTSNRLVALETVALFLGGTALMAMGAGITIFAKRTALLVELKMKELDFADKKHQRQLEFTRERNIKELELKRDLETKKMEIQRAMEEKRIEAIERSSGKQKIPRVD